MTDAERVAMRMAWLALDAYLQGGDLSSARHNALDALESCDDVSEDSIAVAVSGLIELIEDGVIPKSIRLSRNSIEN